MGNELLVLVIYGIRFLNDVKVEWKKVEMDVKLLFCDGYCVVVIVDKFYVFGGVCWFFDFEEVIEFNEILVFDVGKC